jgi:hypothetical protein
MKIWESKKFFYTLLATIAFVLIACWEVVEFTSDQVMIFILAVLGGNLTTHTISDVVLSRGKGDKEG